MFSKRLFLLIGIALLLSGQVSVVHAQEVEPSTVPSPTSVPIPTPIDYALPYPGVLPGHFLYSLKMARDSLMAFFISSPLRKAEFNLLQADKQISASYQLVVQGSKDEAITDETLSKGLKYFEDAVTRTQDAKKEGMDIHDITKRLGVANMKHQEVIGEMEKKVGGERQKKFAKEKERVIRLGKQVKQLRP